MSQKPSRGSGLMFTAGLFIVLCLTRDTMLNQTAPGFSLPEAYGGRVNLQSYRGQPVILAFWMTSCEICRRELPLLSRMAPEFRRKGADVIAVHLGDGEVRDYMRSNEITLTSLVDTDGSVGTAYRVGAVPKLVLIGADGKIKRIASGMTGERTLREWIEAADGS